MSAGLPVITTDSGGTSEIISNSGQNGILVEFGDVQRYAEGLALLINDSQLRRRYSDNGMKIIRERFSLEKTVAETYNLYELSRKGAKDDR